MNDQERAIIEADLRWYYRESDGQCGVRSIQAGFERQMEARALVGQVDGMRVKETRSSNAEFDGLPESMAVAARRASEVHQRLAAIGVVKARTLELAFSCDVPFGSVSADLASETAAAVAGYQAAQRAVAKLMRDRMPSRKFTPSVRPKRYLPGAMKPKIQDRWYFVNAVAQESVKRRTRKSGSAEEPARRSERTTGMTPRSWLAWLADEALRGGEHELELQARIESQAKRRLEVALLAYREAGR